jgi:hypothetical protein
MRAYLTPITYYLSPITYYKPPNELSSLNQTPVLLFLVKIARNEPHDYGFGNSKRVDTL